MEISEIKHVLKSKKVTYAMLSKMSGVPIQTIQKIFSGNTKSPRIDTLRKIEKALGLNIPLVPTAPISEKEQQLLHAFSKLTPTAQDHIIAIVEALMNNSQTHSVSGCLTH